MIKHCLPIAALLLGLASTRGADPGHLVFMIGEDEYHTEETLPEFAQKELQPLGYRVTLVNADAASPNHFPGLIPALGSADLLFLSVRRRTPLKEQLEAVRAHLAAGKPLAGIRTACHAFALRPKDVLSDPKFAAWQEFDPEVIGGHYTGHHGKVQQPAVTIVPGAEGHPILRGLSFAGFVSGGSLYKVSPLEKGTTPLLMGTIAGQPAEPVAWTNLYGSRQGRVFTPRWDTWTTSRTPHSAICWCRELPGRWDVRPIRVEFPQSSCRCGEARVFHCPFPAKMHDQGA